MSARITKQNHKQSRPWWGILFILLPILGLLVLGLLFLFQNVFDSQTPEFIPVELHSAIEADYMVNPHPTPIPGIRLDIIWDTIYDREPGVTNLEERQTALQNKLLTPVPTVTPSLLACQGIHFIYAGQDTWLDSANPDAIHGTDTLLQLGREADQDKRVLLYFPVNDILSKNTLIHSARLEMDVEKMVGSTPPNPLVFVNLRSPFGELDTNWANQPQAYIQYEITELAASDIHLWDVTDIVRDWLSGRHQNNGLVIESQSSADFNFVYYSREIISQVSPNPGAIAIPVGPRLIINCGGVLPQAVAVNPHPPTPTPAGIKPPPPQESPDSETPELSAPTTSAPLPTQTPSVATPSPPLPTPTAVVPVPTPTPAGSSPTPTQAPPSPTLPTPPTNTPIPPPDDDDDVEPPPPSPPPPPPANANLALSKNASPDPAIAGNNLTYTLNATNNGPASATNVTLNDTLPTGVSLVSATASQGVGCSGPGAISCNLGTIANGSSASVIITVTVNAATTGVLTNSATVSASETDPATGNNLATAVTTINTETDLVVTKTDSSDPVVAGSSLTYTLTAGNFGPSDATGIVVTDTLPVNATFSSASTGCTSSGGTVTCALGNLAAGGSSQITIAVTVSLLLVDKTVINNLAMIAGNETDPIPTNNTITETTTINKITDLAVTKSDTPDPVTAGDLLTYTLSITNFGPSNATGVLVTDTLPAGATFYPALSAGSCSAAGLTVTCTVGVLNSGFSAQRAIVVTVGAGTTGPFNNSVTVDGNQTDPNGANNSDTITTTVQRRTDLAVSKSDTPNPVIAGNLLTYTLSITNFGPSNAGGVVVTDTLPAGATFYPALSAGSCSAAGLTVTCTVGALNSGFSVQRAIVVTVGAGITGSLTNSVTVDGNQTDPNGTNNSNTITTTVITAADLTISKDDVPDLPAAGETLTYTLSITNNGPSDAQSVVVTDTLPLSVTIIGATPSTNTQSGQDLGWTFATLAGGASQTIIITVSVNSAFSGLLTNTATITSPTPDPGPGPNNATEVTPVTTDADLEISKSDSADPVTAGTTLSYTLTITNAGPSDAQSVVVTDTLPLSVTIIGANPATYTQSGQNLGWTFATLPGGTSQTIIIFVTVNSAFNGILTNAATITSATPDPIPSNNTATENTDISVLNITKTSSTGGPVNPGQVLTYTIIVANIGSTVQTGVTISDTIPVGTSYVGGSAIITAPIINTVADNFDPNGDYTGNDSTNPIKNDWTGNWLEFGDNSNFSDGKVRVNSNSRCDSDDCVRIGASNATLDNTGLTRQADLSGVAAAILSYTYGRRQSGGLVTLAVSNGGGSSTSLQIHNLDGTDDGPIPQSFDITPYIAATTQISVTGAGNNVDGRFFFDSVQILYSKGITTTTGGPPPTLASGFTLLPGDSMTVTFQVVVDNPLTPTITAITNTASVTSDLQTIPLYDSVTDAVAQADLTISKSDSSDPVTAGALLTYTLSITNNGPSDAVNLTITDTLPAGVAFVSAAGCSQAGGVVTCTVGNLAAGGNIRQSIIVTVNAVTTGTLVNTGAVLAVTTDSTPGNNTITKTTAITTEADLSVSKSVNDSMPNAGDSITYTITVTNSGPSDATGVVISDTLPISLTFVSSNTGQGAYSNTTGLWTVGSLTSGTTITLTLVATVDINAGGKTLTNTAQVNASASPDSDSIPGNNIETEDDQDSVVITVTLPSLSINDVTVTEGDSGVVTATFTISLSEASDLTISVDYTTDDNTATTGSDYITATDTLTFPAGTTVQIFTVVITGDTVDESNESYTITLSNPNNATITDGTGVGTIIDDDNPNLSINDVSVTEGNVSVVFTVTLSTVGVQTATVDYTTANGTAMMSTGDYTATNGTLSFSPGITRQTVTVQVISDSVTEGNEIFFVNLSNPDNATISDGQGVGTIIDDDSATTLCSSPVTTLTTMKDTWIDKNENTENNGVASKLELKRPIQEKRALIQFDLNSIPANSVVSCVTLVLEQITGGDSSKTIYVHRGTASWVEGDGDEGGTAGATWDDRDKAGAGTPWTNPGGDFEASAGGTFTPLSTGQRVVNITSLAQFWVDNPGSNFGLLLRVTGTGGGQVDFASREDGGSPLPRLVVEYIPGLVISDVTVTEGNSGPTTAVFSVTLSSTSTQTITVDYATADNTATSGNNDYISAMSTITFASGITQQTITVTVNGDLNHEANETFFVNLSNPTNASIADGQGVGAITNDEVGGMMLGPSEGQIFLPVIMKSTP